MIPIFFMMLLSESSTQRKRLRHEEHSATLPRTLCALTNRDDMTLCWRQPGWKAASKMFDQHATEPFHGSERGPMNHNGSVQFTISAL